MTKAEKLIVKMIQEFGIEPEWETYTGSPPIFSVARWKASSVEFATKFLELALCLRVHSNVQIHGTEAPSDDECVVFASLASKCSVTEALND